MRNKILLSHSYSIRKLIVRLKKLNLAVIRYTVALKDHNAIGLAACKACWLADTE